MCPALFLSHWDIWLALVRVNWNNYSETFSDFHYILKLENNFWSCVSFKLLDMRNCCCCSVTRSCLTATPKLRHTRLPCPSLPPRVCSNSCPLSQWCHPTMSSSVVPFSSCLQSFQRVSSSHQVDKELEFKFQHQSFQWMFRTNFLYDGLVGSPCSPRYSQETFPNHIQNHQFFSVQLSL